MSENDVIILDSMLEQKKTEIADDLADSDFFEIFTFDQVLKNFDLTLDDLFYGKVGGRGDGGIDGFFTFVNKELLKDAEMEIDAIKRKPVIEVFLIQATRSQSFSESAVNSVNATVTDIFKLSNDLADFESIYNGDLLDRTNTFRQIYLKLASRHPDLKIYYVYASKGDTSNISLGVRGRSKTLKETFESDLHGVIVKTNFWGARELLDASQVQKSYTLQLQYIENYISTGEDNYVMLVQLKHLYDFVTDEDGNIRRYIFESNVRDYQGNVEVNRDIQMTLESEEDLDFWWLNNGITILASQASIAGKIITLDDVQVVNGLQTTTEIYNFFNEMDEKKDDNRSILVRIIVTDKAEARDRTIKATNFQNPIPIASLKATDRFQRDLEVYFFQNGWFYDRRKNYYKNLGKPSDKIISIPYLAQAVMAIILREPDNARARPSSLLKKEENYKRVFSESIDPTIYLLCAKLMKKVDTFLRGVASGVPLFTNNFKFHIAMLSTIKLLGKSDYAILDLNEISEDDFSEDLLRNTVIELGDKATEFANEHKLFYERIAKSKEFIDYLLEELSEGEAVRSVRL